MIKPQLDIRQMLPARPFSAPPDLIANVGVPQGDLEHTAAIWSLVFFWWELGTFQKLEPQIVPWRWCIFRKKPLIF